MNKKVIKKEKFIGKGWCEYAKKKRLRRGDKVGFTIRDPTDGLFVYILNHWRELECCYVMGEKKDVVLVLVGVGVNVVKFAEFFNVVDG